MYSIQTPKSCLTPKNFSLVAFVRAQRKFQVEGDADETCVIRSEILNLLGVLLSR